MTAPTLPAPAPATPGPERRGRRPGAVALLVLQVVLLIGALCVPFGYARLRQQAHAPGAQHPPLPGTPFVLPEPLPGDPQLVVLALHDISATPTSPYTLTPQQFSDTIAVIAAAGYTTATAADVDTALRTHTVTGRKLLLTFDDGAQGLWTYADPVLARYGMHAMAFIITGMVGHHQPYYLTWPELTAMQRSGRWDLESHTHLGHQPIVTDADGTKGPFLSNLQWLTSGDRLETLDEYRARISGDLDASFADFAAHGVPPPHFFAYPFSASGVPANDPAVPGILRDVVAAHFAVAFQNADDAAALTPADLSSGVLRRLEITGTTRPARLYDELHRATPVAPGRADLTNASDWGAGDGPSHVTVASGQLRVSGSVGRWRTALFGPGTPAGWTAYTMTARAGGLATGAAAAIGVRARGVAGVRVVVSADKARVVVVSAQGSAHELLSRPLAVADTHDISVTVSTAGTTVLVDGARIATLGPSTGPSSGTVGVGILAVPSATPWFDHVSLT